MRTRLFALAAAWAFSAHAGNDTWDTTGPLATGVDVRVINALAVSPDGQTLYAGTGAGSVFQYTYADAVPASFNFTDQTGVALSTLIESNAITVSGINVTAAISVSDGEYEINGSGSWRTDAGTVSSGDTVQVRHTSSGSYSTTVDTTLTIGGVSDTFSTTTLPIPTYPVTASAGSGGTASCTPNPVAHGGSSTCTATANTGYSFTGWTGSCTGTNASCTLENIISAKSSAASFTQNTYPVTANAGSGGTASCTPNPVAHGGSSTCTATANTGYSFTGWTGSCTGTNASCTLENITSAKSSAASFTTASAMRSNILTRASGVSATLAVSGCSGIDLATFIDAPPGAPRSFLFGLLDFTLSGCENGGNAMVTITYSRNLPAGAVFYKYLSGAYVTYEATLGADSVRFMLTDGGAGDADGVANGSIRDPGGVGVPGGGAGVQGIPTLSEWGMLILSLLIAGMAAFRFKRGSA